MGGLEEKLVVYGRWELCGRGCWKGVWVYGEELEVERGGKIKGCGEGMVEGKEGEKGMW